MLSALIDRLFNRQPTPDRFAQLFIAAARRSGYKGELVYQADEFRLLHGNGAFFNLHNAYHAYCQAARSERKNALDGYTSTLATGGKTHDMDLAQARPLLRLVIRNRGMLEEIRLHHARTEGRGKQLELVYQPFGEDCVVLLAIDQPEATATLTQGPREEWGITFDEALAIARDNLRDDTPDAFIELAPGVFRGAWQDGYDTSRALLSDVLQRAPVRGQPVFMLPTRDVLLVTGDYDEAGIGHMLDMSLEASNDGRCVSSLLYTYADGAVVPFEPPLLRHRQSRDRLRRLIEHSNYSMQKQFLEKIHEETNHDVFVATYMVYGTGPDSEDTFSVCTWTRDVVTSLPRADRIVLVMPENAEDEETLMINWDEAMPVLGNLLEPDGDLYPPRLLTRGFPSAEQLAQLKPM